MEDDREQTQQARNLRTKEIRVLLPGKFDYFHGGHAKLISEIQGKFKKVHLVVGLIVDEPDTSLLSLTEKVETLKHFDGIDEIRTIKGQITAETLKALKIDFVAATSDTRLDIPEKVLELPKDIDMDTDEIMIRALRNYDNLIGKLLDEGYDSHQIGVSGAKVMVVKLKKQLKQLEKITKSKGIDYSLKAEELVDQSRARIRCFVADWTEKSENGLKKWAYHCKNKAKHLIKVLKEGWNNFD